MYVERNWKNTGESGVIAINADNLNYMDKAIYKKMQRNKFSLPYYYFTNVRELFKPYQSNDWTAGKWGGGGSGTVTSNTSTISITMPNVGDGAKLVNCVPTTYINALKTENNSSLNSLDFISIFVRFESYNNMTSNTAFRLTINKGTSSELVNYAYFDFTKAKIVNDGWTRFDILINDFTIVGSFDWTQTNGVGISMITEKLTTGNAVVEIGSIQVCRRIFDGTYDIANPFQRRSGNSYVQDYVSSTNPLNSILFSYRYSSSSLILQTYPISKNRVIVAGTFYDKDYWCIGTYKILEITGNDNFKTSTKFKLLSDTLDGLSNEVVASSTYWERISLDSDNDRIVHTLIEDSVQTDTYYSLPITLNDVVEINSYYDGGILTWIIRNLTTGRSASLANEKSSTFKNMNKFVSFGKFGGSESLCEIQDIYSDFY